MKPEESIKNLMGLYLRFDFNPATEPLRSWQSVDYMYRQLAQMMTLHV